MKPWIEKYRPKSLEEVAYQDEVTRALQAAVDSYEKVCALPHILLHGPAGTGKTTTALALSRQLFGDDPEVLSMRMLELNASDDRGIHVVREKIKKFSQNAVQDGTPFPGTKKCLPPFKLIILDEADALLPDAQSALRRVIEDSSSSTRFILLCNYLSKIIDPISSRCVKYRFSALPKKHVLQRLTEIIIKETGQKIAINLTSSQQFLLDAIYQSSNGDMRNAITLLQSALQYNFPSMLCEEFVLADIDERMVYDSLGIIPKDVITEYVKQAWSPGEFPKMLSETQDILQKGYSAIEIMQFILKYIVETFHSGSFANISSVHRSLIAIKISSIEKALMNGADDMLQLLDLGCYVTRVMKLHF